MRTCTRCIMDETDPRIIFLDGGVCNHCFLYDQRIRAETFFQPEKRRERNRRLQAFKQAVNQEGGCIMGLSGGMDSSYGLLNLISLGIKPLVLVYDNDWNTDVANHNIDTLINYFGLEDIRVKINAQMYREIQVAFLRSGVMNIEIPTDHFLAALLYDQAAKQGFHYIVHGGNVQNESIMPTEWGYDAQDWKHIKAICEKWGPKDMPIWKLPHMTLLDWLRYVLVNGIKWFPILNYYNYNPVEAERELKKIGWKPYGLKHTESIFTAVFQQYVLPRKFNVDKRKAHYSSLINAGWMSRSEALERMKEPMEYNSDEWVDYVCYRLDIPRRHFEMWMKQDPVPHSDYASHRRILSMGKPLVTLFKRLATASL